MALVRILIDGYSLLHAWHDLAKDQPRHTASAREALIQVLRHYADSTGVPITVVFDGAGAPPQTPKAEHVQPLEIIYSSQGQTADDIIERVAHRLNAFGDFLVVTNDYAERDTVLSLGGMASSCSNFIKEVQGTLTEFKADLKNYNRKEISRYKRSPVREI